MERNPASPSTMEASPTPNVAGTAPKARPAGATSKALAARPSASVQATHLAVRLLGIVSPLRGRESRDFRFRHRDEAVDVALVDPEGLRDHRVLHAEIPQPEPDR